MKRAYNYRPRSQWALLSARIEKLAKREMGFTPTQLAAALQCSEVTVRKVLRVAGLYKKRGAHGKLL